MEVLFRTPHGSRLYGLHHEGSDDDFFVVVDKVKTKKKKYARQSIVDNVDTTTLDLGTWLHYCEMGVPQSLEAMFSTAPVVDRLPALRAGYRAGTGTWSRYLRTIKSFANEGTYKHKRHALRLAMNLRVMAKTGRFNPTLDDMQIMCINEWAKSDYVYEMALDIVWSECYD